MDNVQPTDKKRRDSNNLRQSTIACLLDHQMAVDKFETELHSAVECVKIRLQAKYVKSYVELFMDYVC